MYDTWEINVQLSLNNYECRTLCNKFGHWSRPMLQSIMCNFYHPLPQQFRFKGLLSSLLPSKFQHAVEIMLYIKDLCKKSEPLIWSIYIYNIVEVNNKFIYCLILFLFGWVAYFFHFYFKRKRSVVECTKYFKQKY